MLPRYHIFFGLIFSIVLKLIFPQIAFFFIFLTFISSFLMDFDHYLHAVFKNRSLSLKNAFDYHKIQGGIARSELKRGIKRKGDFHFLHTIEFIAFIGILGFAWIGFFYIFIGLFFHSLLDIAYMIYFGCFYRREFSFGNWFARKLNNYLRN